MRDIFQEIRELTREELIDAIEMLGETVQPSIVPALTSFLDALNLAKGKGSESAEEYSIDEQILAIEANAINLSYYEYVDDQVEIDAIYQALDNLDSLTAEHPASKDQARRIGKLLDQYFEVFCDCGVENRVKDLFEAMKMQAGA